MEFHKNTIFHIYNQGNNRQRIFFSDENYSYFLWKMRSCLLPFGDLLGYCLMPNHFHWLFYVRQLALPRDEWKKNSAQLEQIRQKQKRGGKIKPSHFASHVVAPNHAETGIASHGVASSHPVTTNSITLNESIGILQRSYTRAINKQQGWSGSLFRGECKAKDGWIDEFVTVTSKKGKQDNRFLPGTNYASECLSYIHNNPVEAGLVVVPEDWQFSSAKDYAGLRQGTLCNLALGKELINFV